MHRQSRQASSRLSIQRPKIASTFHDCPAVSAIVHAMQCYDPAAGCRLLGGRPLVELPLKTGGRLSSAAFCLEIGPFSSSRLDSKFKPWLPSQSSALVCKMALVGSSAVSISASNSPSRASSLHIQHHASHIRVKLV